MQVTKPGQIGVLNTENNQWVEGLLFKVGSKCAINKTGCFPTITFVETENDKLWSTLGDPRICPPPSGEIWQSGLNQGHWCLQVGIVDGEVNGSTATRYRWPLMVSRWA